MGHERSTSTRRRWLVSPWKITFCCFFITTLIASSAFGDGQEPAEFPADEPKELLTPVQLIPVEDADPDPADQPSKSALVTPASSPPVRLAPEPLALDTETAQRIINKVEGIRPASFQDLTPGESQRSDVLEKLGEPEEIVTTHGEELIFKVGPFPSVRISLVDDNVTSIAIQLAEPTKRSDVIKELNLGEFEPVDIRDEDQRRLGTVFPERGLMFAFHPEPGPENEERVTQVILERISVEPFLLRVQQTPEQLIAERLGTLRTVQQLVPDDPEAYAIAARIDRDCGRLEAAREGVARAVGIATEKTSYDLLLADVYHRLGQQDHRRRQMFVW